MVCRLTRGTFDGRAGSGSGCAMPSPTARACAPRSPRVRGGGTVGMFATRREQAVSENRTDRGWTVAPSTWVGVALAVLAIAFVVQNDQSVTIQLFWLRVGAPMWLVLLVIFLVGWAVGALIRRRRTRR